MPEDAIPAHYRCLAHTPTGTIFLQRVAHGNKPRSLRYHDPSRTPVPGALPRNPHRRQSARLPALGAADKRASTLTKPAGIKLNGSVKELNYPSFLPCSGGKQAKLRRQMDVLGA